MPEVVGLHGSPPPAWGSQKIAHTLIKKTTAKNYVLIDTKVVVLELKDVEIPLAKIMRDRSSHSVFECIVDTTEPSIFVFSDNRCW
jgi:hypothetical protein